MSHLSTTIILKALDGLSLRADATAQNIANSSTPGYRPLRVTFENALIAAAGQGRAAVEALKPAIVRDDAASDLRLDLEVTTASTTATRYAALVEVLNRQHQNHRLAISENN